MISGPGEPFSFQGTEPFDVFDTSTGKRPIARVTLPSDVAATWSGFAQGQKLARVELANGGIELSGLAEYGARRFALIHAVEVFGQQVVALEGSALHIRTFSGRMAAITIETELSEPKTLDVTTDCSELGYGLDISTLAPPPIESDENQQSAELTSERLDLHDAPGGKRLLTVRGPASPPDYPRLVATRDGYARIQDTWGTLRVDAWLPESQLKRAERLASGRSARAPTVRVRPRITIQIATVEREASISAGVHPGSTAVGSLQPETVVRVLATEGAELGVRVRGAGVEPPEGQYFWVERSALSRVRDEVGYE